MKKVWDTVRKKWADIHDNTDENNRFIWDEDGYCTCERCQEQKGEDIKKKWGEKNKLPDELFEL